MNREVKTGVLVFLVAFNLRLGISSVPPVLSEIKLSLGLSNLEASLLTSVPVLCMGMFAFFVGRMQQIVGRRTSIGFLLMILGVGTLSRSVMPHYGGLVVSAFVIGFAIALIGPMLSGIIKEEFPSKSGVLIGIYSLGMGLGSVIASSSVNYLADVQSFGWSLALGIWGCGAFLTAALWFFFGPIEKTKSFKDNKTHTRFPLTKPLAWRMVLFFGIQSGMFYGIVTWVTTFLIDNQVSEREAVLLLTAFTAVQMLGSFIIPVLLDYIGTINNWVIGCCLCMIAGSAGMLVSAEPSAAFFSIGLLGIGSGGFFPIALLLPLRYTNTAYEASVWTGMIQSFGYILGGVIPVIIGIIIDVTGSSKSLIYQLIAGSIALILLGGDLTGKKEGITDDN